MLRLIGQRLMTTIPSVIGVITDWNGTPGSSLSSPLKR